MIFWMMFDDDFDDGQKIIIPTHHQNRDSDDDFDVDFVGDSFDGFVDGLQDALPSPYNVKLARYDLLTMSNWRVTVSLQFKLARYGLLTIQTGALRSPYNSNWCVTTFL